MNYKKLQTNSNTSLTPKSRTQSTLNSNGKKKIITITQKSYTDTTANF